MTSSYRLDDNEWEHWCLGLKFAGKRPLNPEESAALKREARRKMWYCLLWPTAPLLVIAMLIAFLGLDSSGTQPLNYATVAAMLALMIGVALATLMTFEAGVRGLRLRRDVRAGYVLHFEAVRAQSDDKNARAAWQDFEGVGPSLQETAKKEWLDVLPVTRRILSVNGLPPDTWKTGIITTTAAMTGAVEPETGGTIPQALIDEGFTQTGRRMLSLAERQELRSLIRRHLLLPLPLTLILSVWFWPLFVYSLVKRDIPNQPAFFILGGLAVMAAYIYYKQIELARLLRRDLRQPAVIRVQKPMMFGDSIGNLERETLSISQIPWSEDRRPAPWRYVKRL